METRNGLVTFGLFVLLFAFTFLFCLDALAANPTNMLYATFAFVGFVVCIAGSLFDGLMARRNGEALAVWFMTYAVIVSIVFVWYLTRFGNIYLKAW